MAGVTGGDLLERVHMKVVVAAGGVLRANVGAGHKDGKY